MALTLSILIATLPHRLNQLDNLMIDVNKQCNPYIDQIEILIDPRVDINIGQKRNSLLQKAKGNYIVFIDDDDHIFPNYISLILQACSMDSDCIGISGIITTNGHNERQWHISKEYMEWHQSGVIYYRTPNHISPVKRELALQAGFPEIAFGEDHEYSKRLLPLLNTETIIKENLYHYDFYEQKSDC
jgi:glycosyltransferase involved in cell wall biosynthesis